MLSSWHDEITVRFNGSFVILIKSYIKIRINDYPFKWEYIKVLILEVGMGFQVKGISTSR